jgi:hypothetical protein
MVGGHDGVRQIDKWQFPAEGGRRYHTRHSVTCAYLSQTTVSASNATFPENCIGLPVRYLTTL